jgi:hypothetical protein
MYYPYTIGHYKKLQKYPLKKDLPKNYKAFACCLAGRQESE